MGESYLALAFYEQPNDARHQSYMCFVIRMSDIILRPFYSWLRDVRWDHILPFLSLGFHQAVTIRSDNRMDSVDLRCVQW